MEFIAVFLLILLNGLFAMTEMALVSSKKARLQQLVDKGSIGAIKAIALPESSGNTPSHLHDTMLTPPQTEYILTGN